MLCTSGAARAEKYEYLSAAEFLRQAFPEARPETGKLEIPPALAERLAAVLAHPFREIRVRWWRLGQRTAWQIDEIGKFKPISFGIVVDDAQLHSIAVLVYREGHGMEVAEAAFTRQFSGARLVNKDKRADLLDRDIDNITGSTLSVRAMTRTARAALLLDDWLRNGESAPTHSTGTSTAPGAP